MTLMPTIKSLYLKLYRVTGFTILITLTGTLFIYLGLMVFFIFNSTWIAPTVLSPTSDKMLQFQSGYLQAQQSVSTLTVLLDQQTRAVETSKEQLNALITFKNQIENGQPLIAEKGSDIHESTKLTEDLSSVKTQTEHSLSAGLISKTEAAQAFASIQAFKNSATDSKVTLATLQQQIITLNNQINIARDQISSGLLTVAETKKNLMLAQQGVLTLETSSYAHALAKGSNLPFVPYTNIDAIKVGAPVYNCSLLVIGCYQVGTIGEIYHDEQIIDFPLFNVRLNRLDRGIMVNLNMTTPKTMSSQILFVGHRPLFL